MYTYHLVYYYSLRYLLLLIIMFILLPIISKLPITENNDISFLKIKTSAKKPKRT